MCRNLTEKGLSKYLIGLTKKRVIIGYDEFCIGKPIQKALLSFLVLPLLPPNFLRDRIRFSLRGMAQEIPRILNELGYKVDIINFDNISWAPRKPYDLFIGHAGINFERISRHLPEKTTRIYLSTGIYWKEWNFQMAKRLYELSLRKAYLLMPERFIKFSEEYANSIADGIICLGNQRVADSYSRFPKVFAINNALYPLNGEGNFKKDYAQGRKHFLFFSGNGNVHKGLDLLLEAFADIDVHLHICQKIQPDFLYLYKKELTNYPNIHFHGFVKMRSPKFISLINRCNWIISASCVEGQPGAIIECMGYGLIPVLSDANNINLEDWGLRLTDCRIETIRSTALRASLMAVEECRYRSRSVINAAKKFYSVEHFQKGFKIAVEEIISPRNYHKA